MTETAPVLHMLCGKIASGKSTLAASLGRAKGTVVLSEDAWLSALFADQMVTVADYARCAARLRSVIGPHVVDLLRAGVSVVLDFPANTVETRAWLRDLLDQTGAAHQLHLMDLPDDICLARLHARNAQGDHPFVVSDAQFAQITKHFAPPNPEEGFTVIRHRV